MTPRNGLVIGVVHVDQRAQHLAATTGLGRGLNGRGGEQRARRVAEVLVVALDIEDVGVPGDRPERPVALRLHPHDRVLASQHPARGVEPLLVRVRGRVHEDIGEIGQVGQAHGVPFQATCVQ